MLLYRNTAILRHASAVVLTDCESHAGCPNQDRLKKRTDSVTSDPTHPGRKLLSPLPSGRRYRALHTKTSPRKNSFLARCSNSSERLTQECCLLDTNSSPRITQLLLLRCDSVFSLSYLCQYNPEGCQQQEPVTFEVVPFPKSTRLLILMNQLINNELYLLLVNFGSICDAEIDGLNVPATHSQVEGTAFGLVQIVDVQVSLVAMLHPCQ